MERTGSSVWSEVGEALRKFFFKLEEEGKGENNCYVCLKEKESIRNGKVIECPPWRTLSAEELEVFLTALHFPLEESSAIGKDLRLCEECSTSFLKLINLFLELKMLRRNFHELRRSVLRVVVVGSLGMSEGTWEFWEKQLRDHEDELPSCEKWKLVETNERLGMEKFEIKQEPPDESDCSSESAANFLGEDENLTEMSSVAFLEEQNQTTLGSVLMDNESYELLTMESSNNLNGLFSTNILEVENNSFVSTEDSDVHRTERFSCVEQLDAFVTSIQQPSREVSNDYLRSRPGEEAPCSVKNISKTAFNISGRPDVPFRDTIRRQRRFQCPSCHKTYGRKSHLERHRRQKHSTPKFQCPICGETFPGRDLMLNHQKLMHAYVPSGKHKNSSHESDRLQANEKNCDPQDTESSSVYGHSNLTNDNNEGSLEVTEVQSKSPQHSTNVDTHVNETSTQINASVQSFDLQAGHHQHVWKNTAIPMNKCKFGGLSFKRPADLVLHLRSHEIQKPTQFSCDKCGKTFILKSMLMKHLRCGHKGNISTCMKCGETFWSAELLKEHTNKVHQDVLLSYQCPHCAYSFKSPAKLRRHLCENHKEEALRGTPFVCRLCFHAFPSEDQFGEHLKRHAHLKCKVCGQQFPQKSLLLLHMQKHEGNKPSNQA